MHIYPRLTHEEAVALDVAAKERLEQMAELTVRVQRFHILKRARRKITLAIDTRIREEEIENSAT